MKYLIFPKDQEEFSYFCEGNDVTFVQTEEEMANAIQGEEIFDWVISQHKLPLTVVMASLKKNGFTLSPQPIKHYRGCFFTEPRKTMIGLQPVPLPDKRITVFLREGEELDMDKVEQFLT